MKFIAKSTGKPRDSLEAWDKTKKVLKAVIEVIGFIAAIKTILS